MLMWLSLWFASLALAFVLVFSSPGVPLWELPVWLFAILLNKVAEKNFMRHWDGN